MTLLRLIKDTVSFACFLGSCALEEASNHHVTGTLTQPCEEAGAAQK
jgi:hypothetical protein